MVSGKKTKRKGAFTWVHLSDLHVRDQVDMARPELYLLLEDFERMQVRPPKLRADMAFFTGDMSFSGEAGQFRAVEDWLLSHVLEVLEVKREDLFVVPGNHDVDRKRIYMRMVDEFRGFLTSAGWVSEAEKIGWPYLTRGLEEYFNFFGRLGNPHLANPLPHPHHWTIRRWYNIGTKSSPRPVELSLAGLNSAWMCHRDGEHGRLLIGHEQVRNMLSGTRGASLRVLLSHHPMHWLCEREMIEFERIFHANFDFLCRGHEHVNEIFLKRRPDTPLVEIASGALHDLEVERRYNWVRVHWEGPSENPTRAEVWFRVFRRGKWQEDGNRIDVQLC